MSKSTDTAEFLEELNGGAFASQIGHALSEVAAGVVDHGKAGKLVITLDFSQIGESSQREDIAQKFKAVLQQQISGNATLALGSFDPK